MTHSTVTVQVKQVDSTSVFYQSTQETYHHLLRWPIQCPSLELLYQTCIDTWATTTRQVIRGVLAIDNVWQTLYEAHCLRDGCGGTTFQRTNLSANSDGLRCGEASVACSLHEY